MRKKNFFWICFLITLITSIAAVCITPGSASTTFLSVDPKTKVDPNLGPGATFPVNVTVTDVVDLYGFEFKLGYNTTVLTAKDVTWDPRFSYKWRKEINDVQGHVWLSVMLPLGTSKGLNISYGTLATIAFEVDSYGESMLDLYNTKLGDSHYPPQPIDHVVSDGYFSNTGFCTPVADFTYTPTTPVIKQTVTFNASASYDPDGTIVSYEWNWNDTTPLGIAKIEYHAFENPGIYNVTLTVTDNTDRTRSVTYRVTVDIYDIALTSVIASPTTVMTGASVTVNVTVVNKGTRLPGEYFNVSAYYENATAKYPIWYNEAANQKDFSLHTGPGLRPGEALNVTFTWNTADIIGTRTYTISANACLVDYAARFKPDESDTTNNSGRVDVTVKASHDIAITEVKILPTILIGELVSVNVTVKNEGTIAEIFNVTVYYDSSIIDTQTGVFLDADASTTLIFTWNTTGTPEGIYTIYANATIVEGEVDTADNQFSVENILFTLVPVHDLAIIEVTVSPHELLVGGSVCINVTVKNMGTQAETFTVTIYYDSSILETRTGETLNKGNSTTLSFSWNTIGVRAGSYTIKAEVPPVPEETETDNNVFTDVTVTLTVKVTHHVKVLGGVPFHITIESNSDVSDFVLNQADKEMSFKVTGELAIGFCNVTIPKDLLKGEPWKVLVDESPATPDPIETSNVTHTFLYFTYPLNTHRIQIIGTTVATAPVSRFVFSPATPIIGKPVTFDASASHDPDGGTIVSYRWDFGDMNVTTVSHPIIIHIYSSIGTYTVTLKVIDNTGMTDSATANITISTAPVHDVAIINVSVSSTSLNVGETVSINVTIANKGSESETFNVTVYFDGNIIDTQTGISLSAGDNITLTFTWDTTHVPVGNYTVSVEASAVPHENDIADNTYVDGTIKIKEAPTTVPVLLYAVVAVAIVILTTISVYFIRSRKNRNV